MSINRFAKKRDRNEPEIIEALEQIGCSIQRIDVPCDLIVSHPMIDNNLLIEVKMPGKQPTKIQKDMLDAWPGQYDIVYSAEEAVGFVSSKISLVER